MPCERNTAERTQFIKFMIGEERTFVASPKYPASATFSALSDSKCHLTEPRTHLLFSHLQSCLFLKKKNTKKPCTQNPTMLIFSRALLLNSTYFCPHLSWWEFRSLLNLLKFLPCIYNYSFMGLL